MHGATGLKTGQGRQWDLAFDSAAPKTPLEAVQARHRHPEDHRQLPDQVEGRLHTSSHIAGSDLVMSWLAFNLQPAHQAAALPKMFGD